MADKIEYQTVQEYFDGQPEKTRRALLEIKKCILKIAPATTELFNYNIPAFNLVEGGKREQQIMIAGYKNHIGFYPHPTTIEYFESDLKYYKKGKGSVQFSLDKPLPIDLIEKMIKYRFDLLNPKKEIIQ